MNMLSIHVVSKSKIEINHVDMTVGELNILHPITVYGIPDILTPEMREVLQAFVCSALTPLRGRYLLKGLSHEYD